MGKMSRTDWLVAAIMLLAIIAFGAWTARNGVHDTGGNYYVEDNDPGY